MKKILLVLFTFLFIPNVKAYYCNYTDVANYKKIASNINYSYEYVELDNDVIFKVTLVNLNSALYLKDSKGNVYNYTQDEIVIDARSGETLKFSVYPTDIYCNGKAIYTMNISLPTYNPYYKDEVCKGIENYSLCNKWSTHNLNYESFVNKVNEYKKSLVKDPKPVIEKEKSFLDYIIQFLINYYYIILILIIIIATCIMKYLDKKSDIYN